jgi:hypothetical protein
MFAQNRSIAIAIAIVMAGTLSSSLTAGVVALTASHDNTLYEDLAGALSNGAGEFMFVGDTSGSVTRRALFSFDLASIPTGAIIDNVTLTLHMSMTAGGATNVSIHRALAAWGEGTSNAPGGEGGGAPATTGDATWLHTFFSTAQWSNPGGDFAATVSATTSVAGVNFYDWSSAQMIADVQQWLDSPSGNFGWLAMGDESTPGTSKRFDSRESLTASFRPTLTVEYTIPAPATLAMMALAGSVPRPRR